MKVFTAIPRKTGIILVAALLVLASLPAMAQSQQQGEGQSQYDEGLGQGSQPAEEFDDQTLTNFAAATIELGKIQNDFSQRLQSVQDRDKAVAIQQEMQKEMVDALKDEGIDVQTYNSIANQMNMDEELRADVNEKIQEQRD
ncbi:MAG: DUF4168 domain-containing protein [bacterium]